MKKRPPHPLPCESRIRKALRKVQRLIRQQPETISASYRRGFIAALLWVLGDNHAFDCEFKTFDRPSTTRKDVP